MNHDIKQLMKVNSVGTANQFLNLGWELVTTHKRLLGDGTTMKEGDEYVCFILGWPSNRDPVYPKNFDADGTDI